MPAPFHLSFCPFLGYILICQPKAAGPGLCLHFRPREGRGEAKHRKSVKELSQKRPWLVSIPVLLNGPQLSHMVTPTCVLVHVCTCDVHECTCVLEHMSGDQISPSAFIWILGLKLQSSGTYAKHLLSTALPQTRVVLRFFWHSQSCLLGHEFWEPSGLSHSILVPFRNRTIDTLFTCCSAASPGAHMNDLGISLFLQ